MSMAQAAGHAYALRADGSTVEIRPAGPADFGAVKAMHEAMSPDNLYLRFFNVSRLAAETEARRICRNPAPGKWRCSPWPATRWSAWPATSRWGKETPMLPSR